MWMLVLVVSAKNSMFSWPNMLATPKFSIKICMTWLACSTIAGSVAQEWNMLPATLRARASVVIKLTWLLLIIVNQIPNNRETSCWCPRDKVVRNLKYVLYINEFMKHSLIEKFWLLSLFILQVYGFFQSVVLTQTKDTEVKWIYHIILIIFQFESCHFQTTPSNFTIQRRTTSHRN